MKTSTYNIDKRFHEGGPCRMDVYDSNHGGYVALSKITDMSWTPEIETRKQGHKVRGIDKDLQSRVTKRGGSLSFSMLENLAPSSMQLMYGDSSTTQTATASEVVTQEVQVYPQVIGTNEYIMPFEYGLAQADSLTACTITGAVIASGGSLSADDYYYWVASGYGTIPDNSAGVPAATALAELDQNFVYHTPTACTGAVTTAGTDLSIAITAVEGTNAPAGDFWIVFINTTNSLATATAAHVVTRATATQVLTVTAAGTDVYEAPDYVFAQEGVTYPSGGTPTYTERTITTDYTFDLDTGTFKRVDGGSFTDGAPLKVTYWVIASPNVATDIGAHGNSEDYRRVRIVRIGPDDEDLDPENRRIEGGVWIFDRVNFSELTGSLGFNEDDWDSGSSVTVSTLYDSSTGRIGYATTYSPKHSGFVQAYE